MYCRSRLPSGEVNFTTISMSGEVLRTVDADPLHVSRQARFGDGDAVLDQHRAWSMSVPCLKATVIDSRPSPVDCGHVDHVLDAVDRLLDRLATVCGDASA